MRQLALESQNSQKLCNLIMSLPFYALNIATLTDSFLRDHYEYVQEKVETLVTPDYLLTNLENNGKVAGDCDDISILQGAIYKCMGFRIRFVAIRSEQDNPNYDHVFSEVLVGDDWIVYDLTLPIGFRINYFSRVTIEV
jgi:transglutaminase-like putative cysteine protease